MGEGDFTISAFQLDLEAMQAEQTVEIRMIE